MISNFIDYARRGLQILKANYLNTPNGNINLPVDPIKLIKSVNSNVFVKSVDGKDLPLLNKTIKEALEFCDEDEFILEIKITGG
jgi:hypothetical protein